MVFLLSIFQNRAVACPKKILSFTAKTRKPLLYKEMRVFCILCNIQNFQYFKIFLIFSLGMYFLSESLRLY